MLENPHVFRSLNQRIAAEAGPGLELVCECENEACTERIVITHVEWSEVLRHDGWFVVRPGHQAAAPERVVERQPGFVVVEVPGSTSGPSGRGRPRGGAVP